MVPEVPTNWTKSMNVPLTTNVPPLATVTFPSWTYGPSPLVDGLITYGEFAAVTTRSPCAAAGVTQVETAGAWGARRDEPDGPEAAGSTPSRATAVTKSAAKSNRRACGS